MSKNIFHYPLGILIVVAIFIYKIVEIKIMPSYGPEHWVNTQHLDRAVIYFFLLYGLASFRTVGATELGAFLLFEKPLFEVESGLIFVPFLICSLKTDTRLVIQRQFPGEPEIVDKSGNDKDGIATGKVAPIRITHKGLTGDQADPLNLRLTSEPSFIVRYHIQKGNYVTFLTTIGDTKEAERQMRDTIESQARVQFGKMTPAQTLERLGDINTELKSEVDKLVATWAIDVLDTHVVDLDLGKTVNEALRNVPAAQLTKDATILTSQGEAQKIKLTGEAEADVIIFKGVADAKARKLILQAEAIGMKKLSEVAGTDAGKLTLWLDTMRKTVETSKHTIIPGGEFFSAISGLTAVIEKVKDAA